MNASTKASTVEEVREIEYLIHVSEETVGRFQNVTERIGRVCTRLRGRDSAVPVKSEMEMESELQQLKGNIVLFGHYLDVLEGCAGELENI